LCSPSPVAIRNYIQNSALTRKRVLVVVKVVSAAETAVNVKETTSEVKNNE
jgi:hypothetical protein